VLAQAVVLLLLAWPQSPPVNDVADDALSEPADLVRRLTAVYQQHPGRAVALARRLATGDPPAQSALAEWVHGVLARPFTPQLIGDPAAGSALMVLSALGEQTVPIGFTTAAISGLRMWVRAQGTDAPEDLLRLAHTTFASADSYGGRYLLWLADLLEERKEPELHAAARTIRQRLIAGILRKHTGLPNPEFDQPAGVTHYWLAYAQSREADAERRLAARTEDRKRRSDLLGQAAMHESNAATATINGNRPAVTRWFAEAERFPGPREFVTLHLQALEKRAAELDAEGAAQAARQTREAALRRLVDLSLVDGSAISGLHEIATRLQPDIRWGAYWTEELLRFSPVLPTHLLRTVSGDTVDVETFRGRWRLVIVGAPTCDDCQVVRQQIETLKQWFGNDVIVLVPSADGTADVFRSLGVPPGVPVPFLVAPDGRYTRVPRVHWDQMARMFLSSAGFWGR